MHFSKPTMVRDPFCGTRTEPSEYAQNLTMLIGECALQDWLVMRDAITKQPNRFQWQMCITTHESRWSVDENTPQVRAP